MTVQELIECLQNYDPRLRVCTHGYEGGYCDTRKEGIRAIRIALNVNSEWYYGPHDDGFGGGDVVEEDCVVIGR